MSNQKFTHVFNTALVGEQIVERLSIPSLAEFRPPPYLFNDFFAASSMTAATPSGSSSMVR
jgi:hypothetical protein